MKRWSCRLLAEDFQHGQVIEGLRIENPFPRVP
jgi:predicted nucleic acid-binding protein